jgi:hypothetical protein
VTPGTAVIQIDSPDGSDEELRRLIRWLRDEDDLRGKVEVVSEPLHEGHMGGLVELVSVVLTSTTASALVPSLFDWLARRRENGAVSVVVDGERIEINAGSTSDAERLLNACRRTVSDE